MEGEHLEDQFIQSSGSAPRLYNAVEQLRSSPFGRGWKTGGSFEGDEAQRVKQAIKDFAQELSTIASNLVSRESTVQAERMKTALAVCGEAIINRLEADALTELEQQNFQGLRGVFRGTFDLTPPRLPRVKFAPDVHEWTRTEQKTELRDIWVTKRVWWKLWLGKSQVKETRSVVVTTTKTGVYVGKLGDLLEGFASSGGVTELETFFAQWLSDGLSEFDKTLGTRLRGGVKTYRLALEQRMAEIERGAERRIEGVENHRRDLNEALISVEDARQWRKDQVDFS